MATKAENYLLRYAVVLGSVAALLFSGCSQKEDAASTTNSFTSVYNNTLSTACIECHKPGGSAYTSRHVELDFSSKANAYTTLTSKKVTGDTSRTLCPNVSIVVGGSPSTSYLAGTLFTQYASTNNFAGVSGCSTYPHTTDQSLSSSEQSAIVNWIQNGAKND